MMSCRLMILALIPLTCLWGCNGSTEPPQEKAPVSTELTEAKPEPPKAAKKPEKKPETKPVVPPYYMPLSEAEIAEGWISLFDGHSLFGWSAQNDVNWAVDEQHNSVTASEGPVGLLLTDVAFADFHLKAEIKTDADTNSGLFIRCVEDPQNPTTDAYEINVAATHPEGFLSGSLVGYAKAEATDLKSGEWQTYEVIAEGPHVQVLIDGTTVLDFTDKSGKGRLWGKVGLQKNSGAVAFRNIVLKPLSMTQLFNGTDLSGWHEVPGSQAEMTVKENQIHLKGGLGFLETEATFDDFVAQVTSTTIAPLTNSGLFFRLEKGTEKAQSFGYEAQIHHGMVDEDPTKPENAGMGAIFRRANARRVTSKDHEPAVLTVVTTGPQIATWANGYQVVNWTDTRKPDDNPRKGLRLKAGHLSLQAHDPGTEISFSAINVAPLKP